MSVYSPNGSGNVHVDTIMGGSKRVSKPKKGMGFPAAAASVQKRSGVSRQSANAIIASASRNASPAAKRANPNLKKVKTSKKKGGKK